MAIDILIIKMDCSATAHGSIEYDDYWAIVDYATEHNMKMLPFLDHTGDTIFFEKQIQELQKEVAQLRIDKVVNEQLLTTLETAVSLALANDTNFLKFWGD